MTEQTTHFGPRYRTLDDIRLRKAQLLTDITKDSNRIAGLWNELTHKPKDKNSPTQRFSGVLSTGAGVLDGLVLSWKLYRMFGGKHPTGLLNKRFGFFKKKKNK